MGKLRCPLCGAFTSFSPVPLEGKGLILSSKTEAAKYYQPVQLPAVMDEDYVSYTYEKGIYAILTCQACYYRFVAQKKRYPEEWSACYPIRHEPVAEEIPEPIKSEFEESHLCFAMGAYRGCLLVCRTALIDIQREQGVSSLRELEDRGIISSSLYGQADEVRLWANLVGHEPVLPEEITEDDTEQLLTYLEALLDAVYVQPKRLATLTKKRKQVKKASNH